MWLSSRRLCGCALAFVLLAGSSASQTGPVRSSASARAEAHLDALVRNREYPELERLLPRVQLDQAERAYFEGVLANRRNELEKSISLLRPLLPTLKETRPDRAAVALRSLADNYVKTFRYAEADSAYTELLGEFAKHLKSAERKSLSDDASTNHLLINTPPQTIESTGSFSLPTHRGKIGTIESDFTVNGVRKSWILDTGANFSVVTESVASEMKLALSEQAATTQGASGAENRLHTAVIPEFKIGSAVIRNVVVLVMADKSLRVPLPSGEYQIDAILGYPVLSALGQLTFTADNRVIVQQGGETSGAVVYMQELNPLLQVHIGKRDLLMMLDTGATSTTFTSKYYEAFPEQFVNTPRRTHAIAGAGGKRTMPAYQLASVQIGIGNQTATLKDVAVFAEPVGTDVDLLYGTVGRDLTGVFKSFTLDFKAMRFRVE